MKSINNIKKNTIKLMNNNKNKIKLQINLKFQPIPKDLEVDSIVCTFTSPSELQIHSSVMLVEFVSFCLLVRNCGRLDSVALSLHLATSFNVFTSLFLTYLWC